MQQMTPSQNMLAKVALFLFYGLLAYMPLHIFLSTWIGTSFEILEVARVAKDVIAVVGFGLALAATVPSSHFKTLRNDRLIWLVGAYGLLTLTWALIHPTDQDAELLGVVYNLRFLAFAVYGLCLLHLHGASIRRSALRVVLISGALVVTFGLVQYIALPDNALRSLGYSRANGVFPAFFIDDKPDLERIMSTVRDPNSLGSYLITLFPLALTAAYTRRTGERRWLLGLAAGSLVALWLTFSRSALIGLILVLGTYVVLGESRLKRSVVQRQRLLATCAALLVLIGGVGVLVFRNTYLVQNVILHADEQTVLEDPNQLRVRRARESLERISREPLGEGPGTAGLASIRNDVQGANLNENYYLQIASEVGLPGLVLFLGILALTAQRLLANRTDDVVLALGAGFAGLLLTNMLVHIWSNEAVAYTWWGLAGLYVAPTVRRSSIFTTPER